MFRGLPFQAGWIAVLCAFYCWFWRKSGQTIGMKTWKIRLISKDEGSSAPSWLQCGVRCIVAPPLVIAFGLGYLWSLIDPQKRALQDKLSFTEVVFVGEQKP